MVLTLTKSTQLDTTKDIEQYRDPWFGQTVYPEIWNHYHNPDDPGCVQEGCEGRELDGYLQTFFGTQVSMSAQSPTPQYNLRFEYAELSVETITLSNQCKFHCTKTQLSCIMAKTNTYV